MTPSVLTCEFRSVISATRRSFSQSPSQPLSTYSRTTMHAFVLLLLSVFSGIMILPEAHAQSAATKSAPGQTLRGRTLDAVSNAPVPRVTVRVLRNDSLVRGAVSDLKGVFRLSGLSAGRYTLVAQSIGYNPVRMDNVLVTSGKEVVMDIPMSENSVQSKELVVTHSREQDELVLNSEMAMVSGRTFNTDDTKRYAGALGDPSRMAQNFAGVVGANDARNDIVVRGNSPAGMLWQMEGMNIPNPNHFGALGTSGGPVSMLNNNLLAKSDFFSSAFPAQYGNAVAGVFDLRMRPGNNEKMEYTVMMGFNGLEGGVEGPLGNGGSFLMNYRYSTLALFSNLGIDVGVGKSVPVYQDLSLHATMPIHDGGTLTLFATGGMSNVDFPGNDIDTTTKNFYGDPNQDLYVKFRSMWSGLRYDVTLSDRTRASLTLGYSGFDQEIAVDTLDWTDRTPSRNTSVKNVLSTISAVGSLRHKLSAATTLQAGFIVDNRIADISARVDMSTPRERYAFRSDSTSVLTQAYAGIRHIISQGFVATAGVHAQQYTFGKAFTAGPRAGLQVFVSDNISLNAGYGLHAQTQSPQSYHVLTLEGGVPVATNAGMGFTKSHHGVVGAEWTPTNRIRVRAEGYMQALFDVPVTRHSSSYSALNGGNDFGPDLEDSLVNTGTGRNIGVELTAEHFFTDGFYALATASLFNSTYKGSDGVSRNTAFNSGYVANLLTGKEWELTPDFTLFVNVRMSLTGGRYLTPLDTAASAAQKTAVFQTDRAFSERQTPYFRTDLRVGYRWEYGWSTMEFAIDIQNISDHQNIFLQRYNPRTNTISTEYQQGFFLVPTFRMTF